MHLALTFYKLYSDDCDDWIHLRSATENATELLIAKDPSTKRPTRFQDDE